MTPMLEVIQLTKCYQGSTTQVVNGLNLTVAQGAFAGLLGPNGAGKTTTISILAGLRRKTTGQIRIQGQEVAHYGADVKRLIGLVPQDIALYPTLTARENLIFFGRMYGLRGAVLKERVEECLVTSGLTQHANQPVETYSGGMKRRVNLVIGIIHRPRLLILDEPTVGIDAQSRHLIFEEIKRLNREGMTILYATHYMEEAQQLCSMTTIMDHGKVICSDSPNNLIAQHPGCRNLEQVFLKLTGSKLRDVA